MNDNPYVGWRKASYSNSTGGCVEVAAMRRTVGVRDSKQHGTGPVLRFSAAAWQAFLAQVKAARLEL